jgi:hypothetical protein
MSDKRGDELTSHHNQGQEDYNSCRCEPPHSLTPLDAVVWDQNTCDTMVEDNDAYDQGYGNARSKS